MIIIPGTSHTDHGLTTAHLEWLLALFKDRAAFFIETVELPPELAPLECGLFGPLMGDKPVAEDDVFYQRRGNRPGDSRLVLRRPRPTRLVTVIAGPILGHACVLYTAFGGPASPREPFDPDLLQAGKAAQEKSAAFWKEHALAFKLEPRTAPSVTTSKVYTLDPALKSEMKAIFDKAEGDLARLLFRHLPHVDTWSSSLPNANAPVRGGSLAVSLFDAYESGSEGYLLAEIFKHGVAAGEEELAEAVQLIEYIVTSHDVLGE